MKISELIDNGECKLSVEDIINISKGIDVAVKVAKRQKLKEEKNNETN